MTDAQTQFGYPVALRNFGFVTRKIQNRKSKIVLEGFALKEEFIKNTPLFGELTNEEQRAISKHMRLERYSPNEVVFFKEGESDALYLIKEGWIKLTRIRPPRA